MVNRQWIELIEVGKYQYRLSFAAMRVGFGDESAGCVKQVDKTKSGLCLGAAFVLES
jgi:hypothetical protein